MAYRDIVSNVPLMIKSPEGADRVAGFMLESVLDLSLDLDSKGM